MGVVVHLHHLLIGDRAVADFWGLEVTEQYKKGYISMVEVLMEMGKLSRTDYENWRFRRVPYLEKVIALNLSQINVILRILQKNAQAEGLKASQTI